MLLEEAVEQEAMALVDEVIEEEVRFYHLTQPCPRQSANIACAKFVSKLGPHALPTVASGWQT